MRRTALLVSALAVLAGGLLWQAPARAESAGSCSGTRTPVTFRECLATAAAAYTRAWSARLAQHGASGVPPTVRIFASTPINPCFDATVGDVAEASFWCNKDSTVYFSSFAAPYWTRQYAREARRQGVLAGDARRVGRSQQRLLRGFANQGAATELAHELGHWVQTQTGLDAWYTAKSAGTTAAAARYASAGELAADCMAGWVQGRTAADGSWRNTALIRWANHATIAELGGDLSGMRPHFLFPPEQPVIGHGGPTPRLAMYDAGWRLGVANADGIVSCANAAAQLTRTTAPPGLS